MNLSIILPVCNAKSNLTQCLDSLVKQSLRDYEIILVDDGSNKGASDIVKEYEASFPKRIIAIRIENADVGEARNAGLKVAQGEYLSFVNSECCFETDMYLKMYSRAVDSNADIVICDFREKYPDSKEAYSPLVYGDNKLNFAGPCSNKLLRRSMIENVLFPQGLSNGELYFSAIMLLKSRRTEHVAEPLYIQNREYESRTYSNIHDLDIIKIMDMLADYMLPRELDADFEFLLINCIGIDFISRMASRLIPDRKVIRELGRYVKKHIPKLSASDSFKKLSLKHKLVCWLNCHSLEQLSQQLLNLKVHAWRVFIGP